MRMLLRAIDRVTWLENPGNEAEEGLTLVHRFSIVQSEQMENFDTDVGAPRRPVIAHGTTRWSGELSVPAP
jgi:hypothetical protein